MKGPPLFLLTGPPGVGKTTVCLRLARSLGERGWSVGGIVTLAEGRCRRALDLGSGRRRLLAVSGETPAGLTGPRWGPYRFSRRTLAWGNAVLLRTVQEMDLVVLDEVGPLELVMGEGFLPALQAVLGRPAPGLVVVRPSLLGTVAEMAARPIVLWEATEANRDALPEEIAAQLDREGSVLAPGHAGEARPSRFFSVGRFSPGDLPDPGAAGLEGMAEG